MSDPKTLFLLDAYALIYRSYYAFINNPRITTTGINTSATFGFCNFLIELLELEKPTHIAVIFDPEGPTFRHEMYTPYKAQRPPMPEDLRKSIPYIKKLSQVWVFLVWMCRVTKPTILSVPWPKERRKKVIPFI